jgi:uncharacterized protein (TIGR03382 family)
MMRQYVSKLFALLAVLVTVGLSPLPAHAGVVIVDGRTTKVATASIAEPSPKAQRQLTPAEQQVYLWATMVWSSHDAALEQGCGFDEDGIEYGCGGEAESNEGCSGTPTSLLAAVASLALLRRRRR